MKKALLFRIFGLGAIPKTYRSLLDAEGIVVADEGMRGWFVTKNVKGPGKRFINRSEGFSGCLVVTRKRIICFTYRKRQVNISGEDPNVSRIFVDVPEPETLSVSFESSFFRDRWAGVIELRFKTEKAQLFCEALKSFGARQGAPADAAAQQSRAAG